MSTEDFIADLEESANDLAEAANYLSCNLADEQPVYESHFIDPMMTAHGYLLKAASRLRSSAQAEAAAYARAVEDADTAVTEAYRNVPYGRAGLGENRKQAERTAYFNGINTVRDYIRALSPRPKPSLEDRLAEALREHRTALENSLEINLMPERYREDAHQLLNKSFRPLAAYDERRRGDG